MVSEVTPGFMLKISPGQLGGPYGMLMIELWSATCKENPLPNALLLLPQNTYLYFLYYGSVLDFLAMEVDIVTKQLFKRDMFISCLLKCTSSNNFKLSAIKAKLEKYILNFKMLCFK